MRLIIALLCLALCACSSTTLVVMEDGTQIAVKAGRYELVEFTKGGMSFKMDRRGRPGLIEQIAALWGASGIQKEAD